MVFFDVMKYCNIIACYFFFLMIRYPSILLTNNFIKLENKSCGYERKYY